MESQLVTRQTHQRTQPPAKTYKGSVLTDIANTQLRPSRRPAKRKADKELSGRGKRVKLSSDVCRYPSEMVGNVISYLFPKNPVDALNVLTSHNFFPENCALPLFQNLAKNSPGSLDQLLTATKEKKVSAYKRTWGIKRTFSNNPYTALRLRELLPFRFLTFFIQSEIITDASIKKLFHIVSGKILREERGSLPTFSPGSGEGWEEKQGEYVSLIRNLINRLLNAEQLGKEHKNLMVASSAFYNFPNAITHMLDEPSRFDLSANSHIALREAAAKGHSTIVESLLEKLTPKGPVMEATLLAALGNNMPTFWLILKHKKVKIDNKRLISSYIQAASTGHVNVLQHLQEHSKILPAVKARRALTQASGAGELDSVKWLLKNDQEVKPRHIKNALLSAITGREPTTMEHLLLHPQITPQTLNKGLQAAFSHWGRSYLKMFTEHPKFNPAIKNNLFIKTLAGKLDAFEDLVILLAKNPRVHALLKKETHPLALLKDHSSWAMEYFKQYALKDVAPELFMGAIHQNKHDAVCFMMNNHQIQASKLPMQALPTAIKFGHADLVRALLKDERINPAANNNRALKLAIECGHKEIVQMLRQDSRIFGKAELSLLDI